MKEFIDKLIGRLEETDFNDIQMVVSEVLKKYGFPKESIVQDEIWDALDELSTNKFAIKIVNELAEEYENDFCEWKMFKANARLRHKNCMFAEDTVDPWKFNFCPYCGKKIKVVE